MKKSNLISSLNGQTKRYLELDLKKLIARIKKDWKGIKIY